MKYQVSQNKGFQEFICHHLESSMHLIIQHQNLSLQHWSSQINSLFSYSYSTHNQCIKYWILSSPIFIPTLSMTNVLKYYISAEVLYICLPVLCCLLCPGMGGEFPEPTELVLWLSKFDETILLWPESVSYWGWGPPEPLLDATLFVGLLDSVEFIEPVRKWEWWMMSGNRQ